MALFKNKFKIKTWQELSASVATDGTLSFKPIKKLPKKLQQGKHSYKTKKGWFRRQKIKELASLKDTSGDGELSEGFFIYDVEKSTSYAGYPKQQFNDDMMNMLGSQSFASSAFAQMSESFTSINWPDIVVIQEEYTQETASVQIGWDRVGVILSSSTWTGNDYDSGSVKFLNGSTNDIGMGQSFAIYPSSSLRQPPFFNTASHIHPHLEYTLPVTTASYKIVNHAPVGAFSCSFVLENLESPGYTASDGTVNEAYTTQELAEAMEWEYTGSKIKGESPILKQHNGKFVGFADACLKIKTHDHNGLEMGVINTEQEMKTQVFSDNPNDAPTQHPSTFAIFSTFGIASRAEVTSSIAYRFAYDNTSASGSPEETTSLFYVRKNPDGIGLGKAGYGLGSYLFRDPSLIRAALPGVYTFPTTSDYPSGPSNPYRTTVTTSFNPLVRFSGSTV